MQSNKEFAAALARRRNLANGSIWASDIFEGRIWLGAGRDAENLDKLVSHGITHILNCADDVENFHEKSGLFVYKNLFVADFGGDDGISRVFSDAFSFVDSALESFPYSECSDNTFGDDSRTLSDTSCVSQQACPRATSASTNRVLIHCANGSNRSATITIALLMHRFGWNLCTSWNFVIAKRPQIAPLRDNRKQLLEFELTTVNTTRISGCDSSGDGKNVADSDSGTTITACGNSMREDNARLVPI